MSFRSVAKKIQVARSPIEFFQELKPRKIAALYEHQAQILKDYVLEAQDATDVAIQAATGSGKTLVGLILAEWRRRKLGERPIYLCPTRQLVHQVSSFAQEQLGIRAYPFAGSKKQFPPEEKAGWQSGEVLAVATYSSVFNINPFFSHPQLIVIDDAHAADQYIGEYWTVRLSRQEASEQPLFDMLTSALSAHIPSDEYARLTEAPRSLADHLWVQIVSTPIVIELEQEITSILDQAEANSDLWFRWQVLKGHLKAVQLLMSPSEIIFRPILPPTETHSPFSQAKQRIYMSATLGRGGELERLSGRKSIKRLSSPSGWDGHGVGRRFFIFPSTSFSEEETAEFVNKLILQTGPQRALILSTDDRSAESIRQRVQPILPNGNVYNARDIEISKDLFVENEPAVAIIANRYDGIDFPDDECRLLIIEGKPLGMNLLERYLLEVVGAKLLFAERMRTRMIQAFGRCTRSATDYAIVCLTGDRLVNDVLRSEWRSGIHPELQAELHLGMEQSKHRTEQEMLELTELFLAQGDEWRSVEEQISSLRDEMSEWVPEAVHALESSAKLEINYVNALWKGDLVNALDSARQVIDRLSGGDDLKGFRGMWHYLAGCAEFALSLKENGHAAGMNEHFQLARSVGGMRIAIPRKDTSLPDASSSIEDQTAIQSLEKELYELGLTTERRFAQLEQEIRTGLYGKDGDAFELAHERLGRLLGFNSQNPSAHGAPDPFWLIDGSLCFVFEDHIKEHDGSALALHKARQAAAHPNWVQANIPALGPDAEIFSVLITNAGVSKRDCQVQLQDVSVWPLAEFRKWAEEVLKRVRRIRTELKGLGDLTWRMDATSSLEAISATPSTLRTKIEKMRVEMPRENSGAAPKVL